MVFLPIELDGDSIFILLDAWNNRLAAMYLKALLHIFIVIIWHGWKHGVLLVL